MNRSGLLSQRNEADGNSERFQTDLNLKDDRIILSESLIAGDVISTIYDDYGEKSSLVRGLQRAVMDWNPAPPSQFWSWLSDLSLTFTLKVSLNISFKCGNSCLMLSLYGA